jgi:hypothetical protein
MKRFKYDVYESDGTYITTWADVVSEPSFSKNVNGGADECKVILARLADDFGESDDVSLNNQVIIRCFDIDTNDGVIIFNGFISGYTPVLSENEEYIEVTVMSYLQELAGVELLDNGTGINDSPTSGNTTLTYTNKDPSNIIKDIIDKYNSTTGVYGKINYSTTSIDSTSLSLDYEFKTISILDAIEKIVAMCPANWYWYLDADNIIHLHQFATTPDFTFYVGRDIKEIKPYKRIENVKNVCYVTGKEVSGVNVFKKYERSASITAYGRKVEWINDNRLTDATTMQAFANSILDLQDEPEVRTQIIVIDNNNDEGLGRDIESINPGDVINVLNFLSKKTYTLWGEAIWGTDVWGYDISNVTAVNMNVIKVDYKPNYIKMEVSSRLPTITRGINELRRRLDMQETAANPAAPT